MKVESKRTEPLLRVRSEGVGRRMQLGENN